MNLLKSVIIFGYGKFGNSIANSIQQEQNTDLIVAVNSEDELELAQMDGLKVVKFNVESDSSIEHLDIKSDTRLICAMDNNHENLFLALTLRGLYKENYIIAISDSIHLTDKLKMAGVNRVIDIYQVSGNMIKNILEIPIATKFLQGFINREHNYIFKEITIKEGSILNGKVLSEIDFNKYDIIFIGMIDKEMGNQFIFSTVGLDHNVDTGDILVCIGKESNLEKFIQECGGIE
jgi:voltage-gated potassium channel